MIKLYKNGVQVPFKQWKFPGGEVGVQLSDIQSENSHYIVEMLYENSDDIFVMLNVCDALMRFGVKHDLVDLHIPYFPYARQDRVCNEGESLALEAFIKLLSTCHFNALLIYDVHSSVTLKLLEKYYISYWNRDQGTCAMFLPEFDVLIAPDKGAEEKAKSHTQVRLGNTAVVCLSKTRKDGRIIYDEYPYDTISGTVCVVDDLADAGGTFLALGQMLERTQPNITKLCLYVTHGLFGKGTIELKKYYDEIYVYNLMNSSIVDEVTVI